MVGLADGNCFYVSCERVFNPRLIGRPVVVLSNNDGCAISISDEAKALGVQMGTPEFMIRDGYKGIIECLSSAYHLYGDMSDRMMKIFEQNVEQVEVYSIDEAFLLMQSMAYCNELELGMKIRKQVMREIGIPICVGIAGTKTLAKMANRFVKKRRKHLGVHWAANDHLVNEMLGATEVGDIWGIGRQRARLLKLNGIHTAAQFKEVPEEFVRKNMNVTGQRLWNELHSTAAIKWKLVPEAKKGICVSRSFGKLQTERGEIKEALCNHAASCAAKLRAQKSCATGLEVFIQTNVHRTGDAQYSRALWIELEKATNNTGDIIGYASKALDMIFKPGYNYLKCGITVTGLKPESCVQANIFSEGDDSKKKLAMQALDGINLHFGKDTLVHAVQGFEKRYRLRAEHLSPHYTTDINQVYVIKS